MMGADRDALLRLSDATKERRAAEDARMRLIAALLRGEAEIAGARVRIEWIDPKPHWIDEWLERMSPGARSQCHG